MGDEFLDWLHPEMRHYFRTKFMVGQRSYYEGLQTSDVTLQLKGITLMQEWDRAFWRAHAQGVTDKAFQGVDDRSTSTLPTLGQSYVVGAYAVLLVSLLRAFSATRPHLATWPLWVAAFFHAGAVTAYAMKERPEMPTAQHYTLGVVSLLSFAIFLVVAISPSWLSPLYG